MHYCSATLYPPAYPVVSPVRLAGDPGVAKVGHPRAAVGSDQHIERLEVEVQDRWAALGMQVVHGVRDVVRQLPAQTEIAAGAVHQGLPAVRLRYRRRRR